MRKISVTINSKQYILAVPVQESLLTMLRHRLNLTGTKQGCGEGFCGACTVLLDGAPVNSCLVLAAETDGKKVLTIEGLAAEMGGGLLQDLIQKHGAVQCGFCSPGMLITVWAAIIGNPAITEQQLKEALAGNLCRCGTHPKVLEAALAFRDKHVEAAR